jgi:hypothetical protein
MAELIRVEVAYAQPARQWLLALDVPAGTTAREAAMRSGLDRDVPDLDLSSCPLGIFGKALADPRLHVLAAGERVEIYRPLVADPKEVRKLRAARAAGTSSH